MYCLIGVGKMHSPCPLGRRVGGNKSNFVARQLLPSVHAITSCSVESLLLGNANLRGPYLITQVVRVIRR